MMGQAFSSVQISQTIAIINEMPPQSLSYLDDTGERSEACLLPLEVCGTIDDRPTQRGGLEQRSLSVNALHSKISKHF